MAQQSTEAAAANYLTRNDLESEVGMSKQQQQLRRSVMDLPLRQWKNHHHLDPENSDDQEAMIDDDHKDLYDDDDEMYHSYFHS